MIKCLKVKNDKVCKSKELYQGRNTQKGELGFINPGGRRKKNTRHGVLFYGTPARGT
jgi:hypothetical protein